MKKISYKERNELYPYQKKAGGNFAGQDEENSAVYRRMKKRAYGTRADGYFPIKPIRGRRGRDDRYKDKRKGKL